MNEEVCETVDEQVCETVNEEVCETVEEKNCQPTYKQDCSTVQDLQVNYQNWIPIYEVHLMFKARFCIQYKQLEVS